MAEIRRNIRRRLTDEERKRHRHIREQVDREKPTLTKLAIAKKTETMVGYDVMQLLKHERKKRGLSLNDVAHSSGIDKSRLSKLENDPNENPTLGTLTRIAHAIGVKLTIGVSAA